MAVDNQVIEKVTPFFVTKTSPLCPVCGCRGALFLRAPDRFHRRSRLYELFRWCSSGLVWLRDPPRPEEAAYHYGTEYHMTMATSGERDVPRRWKLPMRRVHQVSTGGDLLDIGCSPGGFLEALKYGSWRLHGVERSPNQARRAETRSGAGIFVGEVPQADFSPGSFDVVTCLRVLEHPDRPQAVLRKVRDWLKPRGVLYLQVPNADAPEARAFRPYWYPLELPRHLYHFSAASLRNLGIFCGIEPVLLKTLPETYLEQSVHYLFDDLVAKCGISRPHNEVAAEPCAAWRVLRKAFRLGVLAPSRMLAAAAGRGASLEAVFQRSADTSAYADI